MSKILIRFGGDIKSNPIRFGGSGKADMLSLRNYVQYTMIFKSLPTVHTIKILYLLEVSMSLYNNTIFS